MWHPTVTKKVETQILKKICLLYLYIRLQRDGMEEESHKPQDIVMLAKSWFRNITKSHVQVTVCVRCGDVEIGA